MYYEMSETQSVSEHTRKSSISDEKEKNTVQCHLCPRNCIIADGKRGNCRVRENQKGKLYSLIYAKLERVLPQRHHLPDHSVFSVFLLMVTLTPSISSPKIYDNGLI